MNNAERKQLSYLAAAKLDEAISTRFGPEVQPNTSYNIFGMGYTTTFVAESPLKERIEDFVEGWTLGQLEQADRLRNPDLFLQ